MVQRFRLQQVKQIPKNNVWKCNYKLLESPLWNSIENGTNEDHRRSKESLSCANCQRQGTNIVFYRTRIGIVIVFSMMYAGEIEI